MAPRCVYALQCPVTVLIQCPVTVQLQWPASAVVQSGIAFALCWIRSNAANSSLIGAVLSDCRVSKSTESHAWTRGRWQAGAGERHGGNVFCRTNCVCHLTLTVDKAHSFKTRYSKLGQGWQVLVPARIIAAFISCHKGFMIQLRNAASQKRSTSCPHTSSSCILTDKRFSSLIVPDPKAIHTLYKQVQSFK